ncbi:hypothetical protein Pcinc_023038 [Petrolisthes cinctipes]|uniref:protein-tyrosine-phosphatase n=1 Tax=Petrolisthes cinctipes TaxID=88211 RepID=A0AAE1FEC5_PETCI|nr:hypothetical protein Pcinc_023038 [Petrolisthes cinctipes]
MPFKLRLRKTRQYNVLSRNVLVISVELLDKTTLECTLSADSTGQDCLHNVCQRLSLHQPEFFGLRYMSKKPYPKVRWVELERPLRKQLDKYAQSPALALAVLYYIHDVSLLQDDVTRSHYFLQVKQDVLEGKLRCNHEKAVLLASYSLQAEFGDHQPDRHTAEYLKDFMLFPKQIGGESEVGALVEAVVWQYSSLQSLAQALAETYYILEAQQLDGYGQETFMARVRHGIRGLDERGSEVYLGTSLMGIDVRPAAGHTHVFYRWNDITNLVNNKRNFGIECQRTDETVHFSFDEPDAAKYVWKMCVKQHTFYKRNQEVLEGGSGGTETRSLAIPDLQSSVMGTQLHHHSHHLNSSHDMLDSRGGLSELTMRSSADQGALASYSTTLPQYDLSYIHQPAESSGHLTAAVESSGSQIMTDPSYGILSQSAYSLNTTHHQQNQVVIASHSQVQQPTNLQQQTQPQSQQKPQQQQPSSASQQTQQQQQHDGGGQQITLYSSNLSLPSTRGSFRRSLLPQYRPAPDYETALIQKYGPGINPANIRATVLYSSQPEISNTHILEGTPHELSRGGGGSGLGSYSHYKGYTDLSQHHPDPSIPQLSRSAGILMPGPLHNTYSTPELASPSSGEQLDETGRGGVGLGRDHELLMYKAPPPYPYSKPSSNSTPDLASNQGGNMSPDLASRRRALLTASLGCLGSPDLSRTYENLADLSEAVESLRHELTRTTDTGSSFLASLHPCSHNYSRNDLDAIYQLSDGRVSVGTNLNLNTVYASEQSSQKSQKSQGQYPAGYPSQYTATAQYPEPQYAAAGSGQNVQEPIYQNIAALRTDEARERTRSAPEIDNNPLSGNATGVVPVQTTHALGQISGEDVQGARSRALSQPVRQAALEPQLYIENRLGEQQQQQQRGPIEAINTAMGQIPVFSAQQELRHNHHHLLHLQQQMQALSIQQQQQLQQQLQLQQQKEQQLQQQLQIHQKKEQHLQQLQVHQPQSQTTQMLGQSSHHLLQHQQRQQQAQEQQRQHQKQEQHRQQPDPQRHQKQLQQQHAQPTPQKTVQQQQQLRQQQVQAVGVTQQMKQQRETSSGEGSSQQLSPRKKWGAPPPSGTVLLAGQAEPMVEKGRRKTQEVSSIDFISSSKDTAGQSRTREVSLENIVGAEGGHDKVREASSDSLASPQGSGRGAVSKETASREGTRSTEGQYPNTSTTSKGPTPDVLKGAAPKGPKDPRAVQLEVRLVKGDIVPEFESIPRARANASYTTATRQDNAPRNRYKDVVPYEENRVKITPTKDNKSGYINASHITASVGESQRFYICCQGPLPNTVSHFWQCVWEADVYLVVMLTSVTGDTATSKSFPYWPQTDNTSIECGQFRVFRKHSTVTGSHVTSRLQVVDVASRKSRTIWHLQYTDWADHGCPDHIQGFISFLEEMSTLRRYTYQEVRGVGRNRNTPVLVHCSAGVGRSGVTVLCDLLLEASDHNLPLDPPKVLIHLRQQRMALVQTIGQYRFVYQVLLAYLNRARLI